MKRERIPASPEHEESFRKTFKLREDLAGDPMWESAYEHAAKFKLWPDELNAIGQAVVRRDSDTN